MSKTGHIYKLCCIDPTVKEIYIGSTTNPRTRKFTHKSACNNPNNRNYNYNVYHYIRSHGGWDNWDMIILEANILYDEKFELSARERHWLDHLSASLNSNVPNRTVSEWREDNKEALAIKEKQYNQDNKEAVKIKKKQYYEDNKEAVLEYQKQYYQDNKEAVLEYQKQKIECDCGITYSRSGKTQHARSKKHKQYQDLYDYITS